MHAKVVSIDMRGMAMAWVSNRPKAGSHTRDFKKLQSNFFNKRFASSVRQTVCQAF